MKAFPLLCLLASMASAQRTLTQLVGEHGRYCSERNVQEFFANVGLLRVRQVQAPCYPGTFPFEDSCDSTSSKFELSMNDIMDNTLTCEYYAKAARVSTTISANIGCAAPNQVNNCRIASFVADQCNQVVLTDRDYRFGIAQRRQEVMSCPPGQVLTKFLCFLGNGASSCRDVVEFPPQAVLDAEGRPVAGKCTFRNAAPGQEPSCRIQSVAVCVSRDEWDVINELVPIDNLQAEYQEECPAGTRHYFAKGGSTPICADTFGLLDEPSGCALAVSPSPSIMPSEEPSVVVSNEPTVGTAEECSGRGLFGGGCK